jgi:hypothetical protein
VIPTVKRFGAVSKRFFRSTIAGLPAQKIDDPK